MPNDPKNPLNLDSVVPIFGRKIDDATINLLRQTLAQAESGELVSVAVIGEKKDGHVLVMSSPGQGDVKRLCCAADLLHDDIKTMIRGARKPA